MVTENEKKEDEKKKMEEMHHQKATQVIKGAEGSAGLLHKTTKPTAWRGGAQILKKEEEDARLLDRCEAKRKAWAKHRQCDESVQNLEDKPWKYEELKKLVEKSFEIAQGENRSRMRWLPTQNPLGLVERNQKSNCGVTGKGGTKWKTAAANLHNDVLLDSEKCHKREVGCAYADVDTLVGSSEST